MISTSEPLNEANNHQLTVPQIAEVHLRETAKWGTFLSILGFIGCGFIVVMAIVFMFSTLFSNNFPFGRAGGFNALFGLIYIAFTGVYFFPCLYLFKSSKAIKIALQARDNVQLGAALQYQKSMFKFVGILTIVGLCFYLIMILVAFLGTTFLH